MGLKVPINFFIVGFSACVFLLFFILGFKYLPFLEPPFTAPLVNFQVSAEYSNGILTASSIIYGIWGFIFASKPNRKDIDEADDNPDGVSTKDILKLRLFSFQTVTRTIFLLGFIFLIMNVLFLVLVSAGLFSEGMALIVTAVTFLLNAFFLWRSLDHTIFRD